MHDSFPMGTTCTGCIPRHWRLCLIVNGYFRVGVQTKQWYAFHDYRVYLIHLTSWQLGSSHIALCALVVIVSSASGRTWQTIIECCNMTAQKSSSVFSATLCWRDTRAALCIRSVRLMLHTMRDVFSDGCFEWSEMQGKKSKSKATAAEEATLRQERFPKRQGERRLVGLHKRSRIVFARISCNTQVVCWRNYLHVYFLSWY